MTELIKQRLVGMLIVVIAGVIFIPDLLDGKKELVKEEFKKIPTKPVVNKTPIQSQFPTEKVQAEIAKSEVIPNEIKNGDQGALEQDELSTENHADTVADSNQSDLQTTTLTEHTDINRQNVIQEQSQSESNIVEEKSENTAKFEQTAWVLRLGTFRNKPNVDALLSKLEQADVKTFVKPVEAKAGILYRVFVGPELEKAKLEQAQNTLKQLTGLDGKITEFQPVN